jgi:hypothetical protein
MVFAALPIIRVGYGTARAAKNRVLWLKIFADAE